MLGFDISITGIGSLGAMILIVCGIHLLLLCNTSNRYLEPLPSTDHSSNVFSYS